MLTYITLGIHSRGCALVPWMYSTLPLHSRAGRAAGRQYLQAELLERGDRVPPALAVPLPMQAADDDNGAAAVRCPSAFLCQRAVLHQHVLSADPCETASMSLSSSAMQSIRSAVSGAETCLSRVFPILARFLIEVIFRKVKAFKCRMIVEPLNVFRDVACCAGRSPRPMAETRC